MASIYRVGHNWRAQIRLAGQPSRSQVFPSKVEAIRWARAEEAKQQSDFDGPDRPYTLEKAVQEYRGTLRHIGSTKASVLDRLEKHLGHLRLKEITSRVVVQFAKDRLAGKYATTQSKYPKRTGRPPKGRTAGPATVLQDLVYLSTTLRHAAAILNSNDAALAAQHCSSAITTLRHSHMVAESARRERRPSEAELLALEAYFDNRPRSQVPMSDIMLFAICTTMRLGEIMALRWQDYNAVDRTIWIRGRKDPTKPAGRDDRVPLITGPVVLAGRVICPVEIIHRQRSAKRKDGRIFAHAGQTVTLAFLNATKSLAIPDLNFHDLRHEGISRLFEAGYSIPQVALVSGHRSWKNLQRYTQIEPSSLHL